MQFQFFLLPLAISFVFFFAYFLPGFESNQLNLCFPMLLYIYFFL